MDITPYLRSMVDKGASDRYFSVGARPDVRIEGRTTSVGKLPLDSAAVRELAFGLPTEEQRETFEAAPELNMAVAPPDIGRFRVNVFRQRGDVAMVIRFIAPRQ